MDTDGIGRSTTIVRLAVLEGQAVLSRSIPAVASSSHFPIYSARDDTKLNIHHRNVHLATQSSIAPAIPGRSMVSDTCVQSNTLGEQRLSGKGRISSGL
jgi:hypothetical protein